MPYCVLNVMLKIKNHQVHCIKLLCVPCFTIWHWTLWFEQFFLCSTLYIITPLIIKGEIHITDVHQGESGKLNQK